MCRVLGIDFVPVTEAIDTLLPAGTLRTSGIWNSNDHNLPTISRIVAALLALVRAVVNAAQGSTLQPLCLLDQGRQRSLLHISLAQLLRDS